MPSLQERAQAFREESERRRVSGLQATFNQQSPVQQGKAPNSELPGQTRTEIQQRSPMQENNGSAGQGQATTSSAPLSVVTTIKPPIQEKLSKMFGNLLASSAMKDIILDSSGEIIIQEFTKAVTKHYEKIGKQEAPPSSTHGSQIGKQNAPPSNVEGRPQSTGFKSILTDDDRLYS